MSVVPDILQTESFLALKLSVTTTDTDGQKVIHKLYKKYRIYSFSKFRLPQSLRIGLF